MDNQLTARAQIQEELDRYQALYEQFITELKDLPSGALIDRNGKLNWYYREDNKQYMKRLKDSDRNIICALRKRRYIKKGIGVLKRKISNCKHWLKNDEIYDPVGMSEELPVQYRDLHGLGVFLGGDINPYAWENAHYEKGKMYDENLRHDTGEIYTRSKSEAMIAMKLKDKGLPFRYEPALNLKRRKVFPDFAVLLKKRRRVVYWEHFGMMDDPEYAIQALEKLAEYAENGIYLGVNLVITFETRDDPLTPAKIDRVINNLLKIDSI
ncbi:MAG: hypothetical protein J6M22_00200 [Firmicutes bacterium]|nr:hypothetical protein [Bacillota bacterium]